MMSYKISVIIPIYNVEQYIEDCLHSVVSQTMTDNVECVLIDDCGNDNSVSITEQFINNYQGSIHFKIHHHEKNRGLSAARNTGIKEAKGDYLFFLDSDDEITPDCLKTLYSFTERKECIDVVEGSSQLALESNNEYKNSLLDNYTGNRRIIKKSLLGYNGYIVAAQDRLVRRELVISNNLFFKEGIIHEDNLWTFFLAKYVKTMAFCSNRMYFHRNNPTSITHHINVKNEIKSYAMIIKEESSNIDPFLSGCQKALILNTLSTAINKNYYEDKGKKELINTFARQNSVISKCLLYISFYIKNKYLATKTRHLLIRIYKFEDRK